MATVDSKTTNFWAPVKSENRRDITRRAALLPFHCYSIDFLRRLREPRPNLEWLRVLNSTEYLCPIESAIYTRTARHERAGAAEPAAGVSRRLAEHALALWRRILDRVIGRNRKKTAIRLTALYLLNSDGVLPIWA